MCKEKATGTCDEGHEESFGDIASIIGELLAFVAVTIFSEAWKEASLRSSHRYFAVIFALRRKGGLNLHRGGQWKAAMTSRLVAACAERHAFSPPQRWSAP